jgi:hypothetical protein
MFVVWYEFYISADEFGVAEAVILMFGLVLLGLALVILCRWLRYRLYSQPNALKDCKIPEMRAKLNFHLKACGCWRWKVCECIFSPVSRSSWDDNDDAPRSNKDAFSDATSEFETKFPCNK